MGVGATPIPHATSRPSRQERFRPRRLRHTRLQMINRARAWSVLAVLSVLGTGACGNRAEAAPTADLSAIQTQAAILVATQFAMGQTQTALAISPTALPSFTPRPAATAAAGVTFVPPAGTPPLAFNTPASLVTPFATMATANGCNDGAWVGETAPFDKDVVKGGEQFSKAWTIDNTGSCTWGEGYVFAYQAAMSNPALTGGKDIVIKADPEEHTAPGHSQTFVVKLTPPLAAGEYKAYYKLRDAAGNYFGPLVYVWVVVD